MAEIQTKTEAVIRLDTDEVEEIRMWTAVIDWEAHPLAEKIHVGLGGDPDGYDGESVTVDTTGGTVVFTKEA